MSCGIKLGAKASSAGPAWGSSLVLLRIGRSSYTSLSLCSLSIFPHFLSFTLLWHTDSLPIHLLFPFYCNQVISLHMNESPLPVDSLTHQVSSVLTSSCPAYPFFIEDSFLLQSSLNSLAFLCLYRLL